MNLVYLFHNCVWEGTEAGSKGKGGWRDEVRRNELKEHRNASLALSYSLKIPWLPAYDSIVQDLPTLALLLFFPVQP